MELAKAEEANRRLKYHNDDLKNTTQEHLKQMEKEVFEFRRGNADLKAEVEMFVKAHPAWATNIAASPEPAIIPQRGSRNMGYVKHRLIIEAAKQTIMKKDRDSKAGLIAMQRIAEAISNAWIGTFYKAWVHIVTETKTDEHEALRFFLSRVLETSEGSQDHHPTTLTLTMMLRSLQSSMLSKLDSEDKPRVYHVMQMVRDLYKVPQTPTSESEL